MKKTLLAGLYVCIMVYLFAGAAYAADVKVGILDASKILTDSKAAKNAYVLFNKEVETKKTTYAAKQREVQTMQEELSSKEKDMTPAVYSEKTAKYSKASKELTRLKSEMEEELKAKNTELNRKLLSETAAIVSDYCKKEKYTIILEKSYVAAFDGAVDITDKIIQLYDATKDTTK